MDVSVGVSVYLNARVSVGASLNKNTKSDLTSSVSYFIEWWVKITFIQRRLAKGLKRRRRKKKKSEIPSGLLPAQVPMIRSNPAYVTHFDGKE